MPRGVQRVEMRQELIDAAAAIIDEGGVDALTVRSLSTRAGCASGVLYNYFNDLDDVVVEIVIAMFSDTIETARTIVADPGSRPVGDVLVELAEAVVRDGNLRIATAAMSRPGVFERVRIQFANDGVPNLAALAGVVIGYLRAEQRTGQVSNNADIETSAWMLIWALHEVLLAQRSNSSSLAIGADRIVQTLLAGLSRR